MNLCFVFYLVWLGSLQVTLCDKEREVDGAASRVLRHTMGADHEGDHEADHQAILGSKKVAEEFDSLPPEEAKRRLRILATSKIDANKDEMNELVSWVLSSMRSLDLEEVQERKREIDENGDGKISWEEYVKDSYPDQDTSKLDGDDKKLLFEDEKYFKAADLNGDGFLDETELAAFLMPENHPHMHKTLLEITMWEKDSNKDGAIDLNEFLGDLASNTESEWVNVEKNRFMAEYDEDKDGLLKGDEVRKWLIPDVDSVAKIEAEHLMRGADTNQDDKLSIDEIVEAHKIFVGSEATNYGEDLHKVNHEEL
ncbi:hypothetical protein WR25_26766 [Diploscapter pachys]|uniref:Reticulocalbin-3 n=1 Tax=Diploscapter pachys TaxID=2018661 RepID=A0A2A2LJ96_9BILA|nr:hypothetical protein WR25_26766 [Diploscapter pachys]